MEEIISKDNRDKLEMISRELSTKRVAWSKIITYQTRYDNEIDELVDKDILYTEIMILEKALNDFRERLLKGDI